MKIISKESVSVLRDERGGGFEDELQMKFMLSIVLMAFVCQKGLNGGSLNCISSIILLRIE